MMTPAILRKFNSRDPAEINQRRSERKAKKKCLFVETAATPLMTANAFVPTAAKEAVAIAARVTAKPLVDKRTVFARTC